MKTRAMSCGGRRYERVGHFQRCHLMNMNTTLTVALCVCQHLCCLHVLPLLTSTRALAGDSPIQWGPTTNNAMLSLSLNSSVNRFTTNTPVKLRIRTRNVSTNEAFLVYRPDWAEADLQLSFTVVSPAGKDVSPKIDLTRASISGRLIRLGPNDEVDIDFNLSDLCKFDEAGTYKVIVKRMMSYWRDDNQKAPSGNGFQVVSNPLYVSVVPDK